MIRMLSGIILLLCCAFVSAQDGAAGKGSAPSVKESPPLQPAGSPFPRGHPDYNDPELTADTRLWRRHEALAPKAHTEKACKKLHGIWQKSHWGNIWICDVPTPDGGKVCNDDAQCAYFCQPNSESAWGKQSQGTCETHYYVLGCLNGMKKGKPAIGGCAD